MYLFFCFIIFAPFLGGSAEEKLQKSDCVWKTEDNTMWVKYDKETNNVVGKIKIDDEYKDLYMYINYYTFSYGPIKDVFECYDYNSWLEKGMEREENCIFLGDMKATNKKIVLYIKHDFSNKINAEKIILYKAE